LTLAAEMRTHTNMITVRPAAERGHEDHGWLDTHHTFSFADYYDAKHMGFRSLRVINEDSVRPGRGFGTHGHRDMEIISYVLEGALEHKDSMGTGSIIRPGDVQRMSAGKGVMHSEFNASKSDAVHFLQIWIVPSKNGIAPSYEQKAFAPDVKQAKLCLVASPDAAAGSLAIHADARVYASLLAKGERVEHVVPSGRHAWIQVARGKVSVAGRGLAAGDGASTDDAGPIVVEGAGEDVAEILVFDLA
jgi:redox-sensitive bicupin YhaK (pirin superfamily)